MLRIIDMLEASADRRQASKPQPSAIGPCEGSNNRSGDMQAKAERFRSPNTMTREMVHADLARMIRAFGVEPDNLSLYEDELVEAEYNCALCRKVGRCRAWSAKGCRGDAPRLFCANAALFEEITPDPFWSETAPGRWHADVRTSPLLRLLASNGSALNEAPPRLGARRLEGFIKVASAIDSQIDLWSPRFEAADQEADVNSLSADLETAIDKAFDLQGGLRKADFTRILQVALCDPRLAKSLCHFHDAMAARGISCLADSGLNGAGRDVRT